MAFNIAALKQHQPNLADERRNTLVAIYAKGQIEAVMQRLWAEGLEAFEIEGALYEAAQEYRSAQLG